MQYTDNVYGTVEISEPVVLELINSPALQRLKDVSQFGYVKPYFPGSEHSRFEHSVGVYLLLNKFNAPLEEQVAGLIHDISHSAFSHCIDYAFTDNPNIQAEQEHQDNFFNEYLLTTNIPQILEKYKLNYDSIIDDSHHPLKEKKLPDLCADRIDYCLRDTVAYKKINTEEAQFFINHLAVKDNTWIFTNYSAAQKFADLFYYANKNCYAGIKSAIMLGTVGQYLGYAIEKKYVTIKDLYTTDTNVLNLLAKFHNHDTHLEKLFKRMNLQFEFREDSNNFDLKVGCKNRNVDPLFLENDVVKRVSDANPDWKNIADNTTPIVYYIKFEE